MKTEQELKDKCTPEFIKWMCELAEGFSYNYEGSDKRSFIIKRKPNYHEFYDWLWAWHSFPLLIHRAVAGFNKEHHYQIKFLDDPARIKFVDRNYRLAKYKKENLTALELALLHCLIEIFKEV